MGKLYGAIEAGGTKFVCAVADEDLNILERVSIPTTVPEETMADVFKFFEKHEEKVLSQLGIPMSTAINMYLNQISLTGGIPFSVSLPKVPASIHADAMTVEEIHQKLEKGYNDIATGRVQNAAEAFAKFRENH